MDLALALRVEQPHSLTNSNSSKEKKFYKKWGMLELRGSYDIKHSIMETFRGVVSEGATNSKQFLVEI